MKTVLITVGRSIKARKLLWTDFLKVLRESPDLRVVLIVPRERLEFYKAEFGSKNIIVDIAPDDSFSSKIDFLTRIVPRLILP